MNWLTRHKKEDIGDKSPYASETHLKVTESMPDMMQMPGIGMGIVMACQPPPQNEMENDSKLKEHKHVLIPPDESAIDKASIRKSLESRNSAISATGSTGCGGDPDSVDGECDSLTSISSPSLETQTKILESALTSSEKRHSQLKSRCKAQEKTIVEKEQLLEAGRQEIALLTAQRREAEHALLSTKAELLSLLPLRMLLNTTSKNSAAFQEEVVQLRTQLRQTQEVAARKSAELLASHESEKALQAELKMTKEALMALRERIAVQDVEVERGLQRLALADDTRLALEEQYKQAAEVAREVHDLRSKIMKSEVKLAKDKKRGIDSASLQEKNALLTRRLCILETQLGLRRSSEGLQTAPECSLLLCHPISFGSSSSSESTRPVTTTESTS